jgi:hypothetical protein
LEEVLACFNGWFSSALLSSPLLVELQSGRKWPLGYASIRFLYCVFPLLQCHSLGIYFAYMTLRSNCHYIPVGMGMHWLECVIGIDGNVQWNTSVLSETISYLAFDEWVENMEFSLSSVKYLLKNHSPQMQWLPIFCIICVHSTALSYRLHGIQATRPSEVSYFYQFA